MSDVATSADDVTDVTPTHYGEEFYPCNIVECDACHEEFVEPCADDRDGFGGGFARFCPHCGRRLAEPGKAERVSRETWG